MTNVNDKNRFEPHYDDGLNIISCTQHYDRVEIEMIPVLVGNPNGNTPHENFMISSLPITCKVWNTVMDQGLQKQGNDLHPVTATVEEIKMFVRRITENTVPKYRLPTYMEWQFAAMGGLRSKGFVFSGSNRCDDVAYYKGTSDGRYGKVGVLRPNELGLYDMSGNAWELCRIPGERFDENGAVSIEGESSYCICGGDKSSPEELCRPISCQRLVNERFLSLRKIWQWKHPVPRVFLPGQKTEHMTEFGFRLAMTMDMEEIRE